METDTKNGNARQKVAILGGGIGSLSTAWELAKTDKYDITIHQLGWRLGGKLATGRDAEAGMRIQEHGIHGFLGCYYNAGVMMEEIFQYLAQPDVDSEYFFTSFNDAFVPQDFSVMWENISNQWSPWPVTMPANSLTYGNLPSLEKTEQEVIAILRFLGVQLDIATKGGAIKEPLLIKGLEEIIKLIEKASGWASAGKMIVALTEKIWVKVRAILQKASELTKDAELRRALILIDFIMTLLNGFFHDDIPKNGYQSLDDEDYCTWLKRHGALDVTLESPLVMNTPDITYNFPGGDMTVGPQMSAGCFLQWSLRTFGYVGAFVLAFRAGSGETVLAPIYQALKQKGVRFEFFSKVTNLKLSNDKSSVASVDISIQATTKDGESYQPLIGPVANLLCWPSCPNYEQLVEGKQLQEGEFDLESWWTPWKCVGEKTLEAGVDYDHLVLGISLGAVPYICKELIDDANNPPLVPGSDYISRWQGVVTEVKTIQSQAMQLWFKQPVKSLLNPEITVPDDNEWIAGTYVLPLSGQADFSNLIPFEDWGSDGPLGLFYLCGPMSDSGMPPFDQHDFPAMQSERVRAQSIQYLEACAGPVLTEATTQLAGSPRTPGSLDFGRLYVKGKDDKLLMGTQRFDAQFWRANIDPTERYVTCLPGTSKFRIPANNTGYTNLTVSGDWIDTGLNVGSVEGAVMGGKLASNAIAGTPPIDEIWGFDPFGLRSS